MTLEHNELVGFDEWIEGEQSARVRHELVGGVLFAMTGGTLDHNLLTSAFADALRPSARRHDCRVYQENVALRIGDVGYYPDVMVVCGPRADDLYETDPCLVVEVLSPSTSSTDRREKLAAYRTIPSLRAYVQADPVRRIIQLHHLDGQAWLSRIVAASDTFELRCPPVELAFDELYADLSPTSGSAPAP